MRNIYNGCPVCEVGGRKNFKKITHAPLLLGYLLTRCESCGTLYAFTPREMKEFDKDKEDEV